MQSFIKNSLPEPIKNNSYLLEIACFNETSAMHAFNGGANRIELCSGKNAGGLTPCYNTFKNVKQNLSIDIYVMIRPCAGNFIYTDIEFEKMKVDLLSLKQLNADGFVFGILDENGNVNRQQNKILVNLAHPLPCTFHKAFDQTNNVFNALEDCIECGFKNILTSGGAPSAVEGTDKLKQLLVHAKKRINIIASGSVRSNTIAFIKEQTGITYFHSSAIGDTGDTASLEEIIRLMNC
ncbi:MAG: copper homeostasis protein CutC [Bacteroidia bacterium]|nr:copper homeostasis protein CutC [Bacteroidia bacterium]